MIQFYIISKASFILYVIKEKKCFVFLRHLYYILKLLFYYFKFMGNNVKTTHHLAKVDNGLLMLKSLSYFIVCLHLGEKINMR